ncbi:Ger(x)C family spore germination protein [Paenibacillus lautus]|uniref:Ger(x)C family spore germination protein n=1 Tax=Paenibacillus lautus TaxID=1401 RepID=UPI003D2E864E
MVHSKIILIGVCLCCLTGCWDKVEINQLAIGELIGADMDPNTRKQIVYYQIVNPEAVARAGIKSPVYTYRVQASSIAELGPKTSDIMPRKLFPNQYQSEIITERYARQGLQPFLNLYERQYNRSSNLYLFITDSLLSDVMMTYLPLERLPGSYLRSLVENQSESTGRVSKKSRIRDLVENMESSILTVMPMVSLSGANPFSTTDRYEQINANQGNLILSGGAVFKHDRMIGKLKLKQMAYYVLLKGESELFFESLTVNDRKVDVQAIKPKVHKRLYIVSGEPVWKVDISTRLVIINNEQEKDLTLENLSEITEAFNRQVQEKITDLYQDAIKKEWDLFGLEGKIKYKRGKKWAAIQKQNNAWNQTKLQLSVKSKITEFGEIINPYKGVK